MKKYSAKFWNFAAKRYAKSPVKDKIAYKKKLQITREYLKPNMNVLEFGSGTGSTAIAHAPYVRHVNAMDVSSKMTEIAKSKSDIENIKNITFTIGNIENFSTKETYDVVMGHSILHLLDNKEVVIAKVYTLLKPGGVFVSSTMCLANPSNILKVILSVGNFFGFLPLVRFFSRNELKNCLTNAGFLIDREWQPSGEGRAIFFVAKKST